jgi:hypothetical protein
MSTTRMPRGAIPSPRHKLAGSIPHALVGTTPPNILHVPQKLSFWGNNTYGDCVTAEEAFAKATHDPEIFISEQEAIQWATQHNFLNGAVIIDVLETMTKTGFKQTGHVYDDGPARSVNWTDSALLRNAISLGPVKIGVAADQLDTVYTGKNGWIATGFHQDSAEDHCVSLCGYGTLEWLAKQLKAHLPTGMIGSQPGYAMFTWDTIGIIDEPSLLAITHEAWLRRPTTEVH